MFRSAPGYRRLFDVAAEYGCFAGASRLTCSPDVPHSRVEPFGLIAGDGAWRERARGRTFNESGPGGRGELPF